VAPQIASLAFFGENSMQDVGYISSNLGSRRSNLSSEPSEAIFRKLIFDVVALLVENSKVSVFRALVRI